MGLLPKRKGLVKITRSEEQINEVKPHPKVEAGRAMAQRGNAKNQKRREFLEAKSGKGNLTRSERRELERLSGLE